MEGSALKRGRYMYGGLSDPRHPTKAGVAKEKKKI